MTKARQSVGCAHTGPKGLDRGVGEPPGAMRGGKARERDSPAEGPRLVRQAGLTYAD